MMETTNGSSKTPNKHLNRLPKKSGRFRYKVTMEKRFPKKNQKQEKKKTISLMKRLKPKRIGFIIKQQKQVTE
jgi:hypothetical protein